MSWGCAWATPVSKFHLVSVLFPCDPHTRTSARPAQGEGSWRDPPIHTVLLSSQCCTTAPTSGTAPPLKIKQENWKHIKSCRWHIAIVHCACSRIRELWSLLHRAPTTFHSPCSARSNSHKTKRH